MKKVTSTIVRQIRLMQLISASHPFVAAIMSMCCLLLI